MSVADPVHATATRGGGVTLPQTVERKSEYQKEVRAMMFTFGDVREPLAETSQLVEDYTHRYIVDVVRRAAVLATSHGHALAVDHVLFLSRRDPQKTRRLLEFLAWKGVRRAAERDGSGAGKKRKPHASPEPHAHAHTHAAAAHEDDHEHDALGAVHMGDGGGGGGADGPLYKVWWWHDAYGADPQRNVDMGTLYAASPSRPGSLEHFLATVDSLTTEMTAQQYLEFSKCRAASFTYQKEERFTAWADLRALGVAIDSNVIDVLGYLAWEAVGHVTQAALLVQQRMEGGAGGAGKRPLHPVHVREALRQLTFTRHSVVGEAMAGSFLPHAVYM